MSDQNQGFLKKYRVSAYECDYADRLKVGTVFDWFQDSMDEYSSVLGFGRDFCKSNGLSYILRGYNVQIDDLPQWTDSVSMHTAVTNASSTSFFIKQTLYDNQMKQRLLSSCGQVVLMDVKNGRPARVRDVLPSLPALAAPNAPLDGAPLLQKVDDVYEAVVPLDYIDFNQHVNNSKYVIMAERGLSPELRKKIRLKRIAIAYKKGARLGDHLKIQTQLNPLSSWHQIVSKDNEQQVCARVAFAWDKQSRE